MLSKLFLFYLLFEVIYASIQIDEERLKKLPIYVWVGTIISEHTKSKGVTYNEEYRCNTYAVWSSLSNAGMIFK